MGDGFSPWSSTGKGPVRRRPTRFKPVATHLASCVRGKTFLLSKIGYDGVDVESGQLVLVKMFVVNLGEDE